jgi:hypothetical protein
MQMSSRLVVGAGAFLLIVMLSALLPSAAGLMLTFPALNGLAFLFSEQARAAPMARTMLWMPVVNGALCALYIVLFLRFGRAVAPLTLSLCLAGLVVGLWLAAVTLRPVRDGIAPENHLAYAVAASAVGLLLVVVALALPMAHPQTTGLGAQAGMVEAITGNAFKILLFIVGLSLFLFLTEYLPMSDSGRGILAGLPIVPFGGLVGISADGSISLDDRLAIFGAMATSIWLAPAIAIWFIYGLCSFLTARTFTAPVRFLALLLGWLICFAAIVTIGYAIDVSSFLIA